MGADRVVNSQDKEGVSMGSCFYLCVDVSEGGVIVKYLMVGQIRIAKWVTGITNYIHSYTVVLLF